MRVSAAKPRPQAGSAGGRVPVAVARDVPASLVGVGLMVIAGSGLCGATVSGPTVGPRSGDLSDCGVVYRAAADHPARGGAQARVETPVSAVTTGSSAWLISSPMERKKVIGAP
ncbi:hypothetical protein GCM10010214_24670 [Streptomyces abikoensis]|nr:hypothetical protein GCM10010214_24670 [Streptomyces abikoensis]